MFSGAPFSATPFGAAAGFLLSATLAEGASSAVSTQAGAVFTAQVTEASSAATSDVTFVGQGLTVSEMASGGVVVRANVVYPVTVSEAVSASEAGFASVNFVVRFADGAAGGDAVSAAQVFTTKIAEMGVAADSPLSRLLWEAIQTGVADPWSTISTIPLSLRVSVGAGFSAGAISSGPFSALGDAASIAQVPSDWQTINNINGVTWTPVKTVN